MHSGNPGQSAIIRMMLVDGTPDGLRFIDKSDWNGLAVMCSRARYAEARDREEIMYPGVYLLYGASWTGNENPTLFIGHADNVREQLDRHHRTKSFWTHLAIFAKRLGQWNTVQAPYLESRLTQLALRTERAEVVNMGPPGSSRLSSLDRAEAESLLEQILVLCPLLGLEFFSDAQNRLGPLAPAPLESSSQSPGATFRAPSRPFQPFDVKLVGPGAAASGRAVGREVEVFAGAVARADAVPSLGETYVRLREELEARGILRRSPEGLVFTQNHTFRSPSASAIVLLGRPASGWNEWKDAQGRSLRQLQEMLRENAADHDE